MKLDNQKLNEFLVRYHLREDYDEWMNKDNFVSSPDSVLSSEHLKILDLVDFLDLNLVINVNNERVELSYFERVRFIRKLLEHHNVI